MNQQYMKEKTVFSLLITMGIPMILSMIVGAIYNIVDSIFVSMISEEAMTALSLVYPVQNLAHSAGVGFGVGINALVSRRLGEGRPQEADRAASQGLFLSVVHGIVLTFLGLLIIRPYLGMYTENPQILQDGVEYFTIVFLFSTADSIGMAFEKIYQALGKMMIAMTSVLIGCGINLILDPLLIFGIGFFPDMGIRGAALATGLGQTGTMLFYLVLYYRKPLSIRISRKYMRPMKVVCSPLYSVGISAALNLALTSLLLSALNGILAGFSQSYVLILGVYYKLQSLLYLASSGLVQGMRPLISYNYGAGEHRRVRSIYVDSIFIVAVIMLFGMGACQIFPAQLIGLFSSNPETISGGTSALRIISWGFVISSVSVVTSGAFEGLGKGGASLLISLCRYVIIILPTALLLSRVIGPEGVWHAFWIAELITAGIAGVIWHRKRFV